MDKQLAHFYSTLSEEELAHFSAAGMKINDKLGRGEKRRILNRTLRAASLRRSTVLQKKPAKIAFASAALLCLLALGAAAAAKFALPKGLTDSIDSYRLLETLPILTDTGAGVEQINTEVESAGYRVTFAALARGEYVNTDLFSDRELPRENLFAVFTVRRLDGAAVADWNKNFDDVRFGQLMDYQVLVKGYASGAFQKLPAWYAENDTLYLMFDVTEAQIVADHTLLIAVTEGECDAQKLRMDEQGAFYFLDSCTGIHALFTLPLPDTDVDPAASAEFLQTHAFQTKVDYAEIDRMMALDAAFIESGIDLTPVIGKHEWRGSWPLQFGEIPHAADFLSMRNDRPATGVISYGDLCDRVETLFYETTEINVITRADLPLEATEQRFQNGDAYFFVGDDMYLFFPAGQESAELVVTLPGDVVIRLQATDESLSNILQTYRAGIAPPAYAAELYLTGGYRENPWLPEDAYRSAVQFYESDADARYDLVLNYSYYTGTVCVSSADEPA